MKGGSMNSSCYWNNTKGRSCYKLKSIIMTNKEKGFTLIELLIVIGIIAILAAAVIIAINPGRQFTQARNATRWSHVNSIANAIYAYAVDNDGVFPTPCVSAGWTAVTEANCGDLTPTYMQALPTDPQTGGNYEAELDGTRVSIRADQTASDTDKPVITQ